jgi:hypothetical protein
MRVKQKYKNALAHYLEWITDDFLRPKFGYDETAISAAEAMLRWETYGEALPTLIFSQSMFKARLPVTSTSKTGVKIAVRVKRARKNSCTRWVSMNLNFGASSGESLTL